MVRRRANDYVYTCVHFNINSYFTYDWENHQLWHNENHLNTSDSVIDNLLFSLKYSQKISWFKNFFILSDLDQILHSYSLGPCETIGEKINQSKRSAKRPRCLLVKNGFVFKVSLNIVSTKLNQGSL